MNKYNEPIYKRVDVQQELKISLWERVLLFFIPAVKVENEEIISHFKKLGGKFYLVDFKLKDI
jgi:hypothetical protein